jgi:hypothetical protein
VSVFINYLQELAGITDPNPFWKTCTQLWSVFLCASYVRYFHYLYNDKRQGWRTSDNLVGSGVKSRKNLSEERVSPSRFKSSTSRKHVYHVTARPTRVVNLLIKYSTLVQNCHNWPIFTCVIPRHAVFESCQFTRQVHSTEHRDLVQNRKIQQNGEITIRMVIRRQTTVTSKAQIGSQK